jgi:hypothetical protein
VVGLVLLGLIVYGIASDPALNGCDNMAGECIRARQGIAKDAVWTTMFVAAIICLRGALWPPRGRWVVPYVTVVALSVAMSAAFIAVRPDHKLENRYKGWLHATAPPARGQGV